MGVRFFLFRAAKPVLLDQENSRSKTLSFIGAPYQFIRFRSSLHLEGYFVLESETCLKQYSDETHAVIYVGELSYKELKRYSEGLNKESAVRYQRGDFVLVKEGEYKGLTGTVEDQLGDRLAVRPALPRGYVGSLIFLRQKIVQRCKIKPEIPQLFQMNCVSKPGVKKETMRNIVLLVDGKYLLYRSHYAYPTLRYEDRLTGGLFGFFTLLITYLEKFEPKKVYVIWDSSIEKKLEIIPEYKANRNHGEVGQRVDKDEAVLRSVLPVLGIHQAWAEHSEADDVIGHYSRLHGQSGVIILSEDKDLLQFTAGKNVYLSSEVTQIRGASFVRQNWGIEPDKIPLFRAIRGDTSDNLAGIPRFSTEKLRLLCKVCATPEDVFSGLEQWRVQFLLSDLLTSKLLEFKERIYKNFTLMRLDHLWGVLTEVQGKWDEAAFKTFCDNFGLESLQKKTAVFSGSRGMIASG